MTALGNVCNQALNLIFYTYHNRSFILILVLDDMRHLSAHFSASPWLHPCVEKRIANLEQNHFPTSICSFQKVEKQIFFANFEQNFSHHLCMCSLQKWKTELEIVDRIYSRHLPVPCSSATRDPDTWGNNEMKEKNIQGKLLLQN